MTMTKFKYPEKETTVEQKAFSTRFCGKEQIAYESFNWQCPDTCTVYCVPAGECQGRAQSGQLKNYGITGQEGTCQKKGFTERAELGVMGKEVNDSLKFLVGPCKGMTMTKYKYPEQQTTEQVKEKAVSSKFCGKEQTPYESFNFQFPDTCTVFCVPAGECEGRAQQGQMKNYGITGQGTCQKKGFTERAELGLLGKEVNDSLKFLQGPCKGMTMTKYKYPEQQTPEQVEEKTVSSKFCGKEQTPYESFNWQFPDTCTVFCVPAGECEG